MVHLRNQILASVTEGRHEENVAETPGGEQGDGSVAFFSVTWGADGLGLVTAFTAYPAILIHDVFQLPKPVKQLLCHKDGIPALALSPDSASGSIDHSIQIYTFRLRHSCRPVEHIILELSRWRIPEQYYSVHLSDQIRSLTFNKSGSLLASMVDLISWSLNGETLAVPGLKNDVVMYD